MSQVKRCTVLSLMVLLWTGTSVRGQEEHVFLVLSGEHSLSGFRVKGTKGIITALHGVAGSEVITAVSSKGPILNEPLKIKAYDLQHDVALIGSAQMERLPAEGFSVPAKVDWNAMAGRQGQIGVIGYPVGIDLKELWTPLTLRRPPTRRLKEQVDAKTRKALSGRRSPDPSIVVASISGDILPGHSGAPILNSNGQVVAVANGGLRGTEITWAVPYPDINWTAVKGRSIELEQLAESDSSALFALGANPRHIGLLKKIDDVLTAFGDVPKGWKQVGELTNSRQEIERSDLRIFGDFRVDLSLTTNRQRSALALTLVGADEGRDLTIEGYKINSWSGVDTWNFVTPAKNVRKGLLPGSRTLTLQRKGQMFTLSADAVYRPDAHSSTIAQFVASKSGKSNQPDKFRAVRLRFSGPDIRPERIRVQRLGNSP